MKKFLFLILATVLMLSLIACSRDTDQNDNGGNSRDKSDLQEQSEYNSPPIDLDETSVNDFEFEYSETIGGIVIKKYNGVAFRVRIPENINGKPVLRIEGEHWGGGFSGGIVNGAFSQNDIVNEIYIPDGVTSIGARAFDGCANLKSIVIPNSVTEIGEETFRNCVGLESVVIPVVGLNMFEGCENLTSIIYKGDLYSDINDITNYKKLTVSNDILRSVNRFLYNYETMGVSALKDERVVITISIDTGEWTVSENIKDCFEEDTLDAPHKLLSELLRDEFQNIKNGTIICLFQDAGVMSVEISDECL